MYQYNRDDQSLIDARVEQFRDQTQRYLAGQLSESEFLPLRLQNGLYIQRLAPMLRIAIPYGMLSSRQLRKLAHIMRYYDKGYGHISTRQNIQLNWSHLEEVPDILAELAEVQMHAIQTSGNCVRNITTDQFAGVARDEIVDPRPWCELVRQWSTFHPEFAFLPRKFKIAVSASKEDRTAVYLHDIGLLLRHNAAGEIGFKVLVGGGLGRTPVIGSVVREFLPYPHLLNYLDAILRVYNQFGRRDNRYKARIKILVRSMGTEKFTAAVEKEWQHINAPLVDEATVAKLQKHFPLPAYDRSLSDDLLNNDNTIAQDNSAFAQWMTHNVMPHRQAGYAIVNLSLKRTGMAPGDITDDQMDAIADLADEYSYGEARTTHEQNLVLADIRQSDLPALWKRLTQLHLATANIGTLHDIICCPGGDFCSLANAKSIPIAESIQRQIADMQKLYDLGDIDLNISGCMNACGHHHIGHIGILGVDKKGAEFYQVSLGGNAGFPPSVGTILGPSFAQERVPQVIESIVRLYVDQRQAGERFIETYRRIGIEPFRTHIYPQ